MGHSIGISDSYYKATQEELLTDYIKAVDYLTISNEYRLQKNMSKMEEQFNSNDKVMKSELCVNRQQISILTERDSSNSDAIAALSDQVVKLMNEVETLKRKNSHF